ncbi:unnamed protein product [Calypogeia fissa]
MVSPEPSDLDEGETPNQPIFELPDITDEVLEHVVELQEEGEKTGPSKTTMLVRPSLSSSARKELHYNIMQDIEKRLAEVTIGQLLRDNPKYRRQVMEAVKIRRRRGPPPTITDVRYTAVEDWGAPEIDIEIDGCMITRVPVDGGSGVNVMMEQTAADLGYTEFEPTPKILRMANQEEVIPVGKLSQNVTRMGELEYQLNFVVIRLPIPSTFQVLLGRPWLYKVGAIEDWKKKEFRIGSARVPWIAEIYQGETTTLSEGYTTDSGYGEEEDQVLDCWMVVDAFKTSTEELLRFSQPKEECVEIKEEPESEPDADLKEGPEVVPEPEGKPEGDSEGERKLTRNDLVTIQARTRYRIKETQKEEPLQREEHSLGVLNVPMTTEWVQEVLKHDPGMQAYYDVYGRYPEEDPSPTVKTPQFEKLTLERGEEFFVGKGIPEAGKEDLKKLLSEYKDVFAWSHQDLTSILPKYGEHR